MRRFGIAALALFSLLGLSFQTNATVLVFEPAGSNSSPISPEYGDRVTATPQNGFIYGEAGGWTPNVVVNYGPIETDIHRWNTSYGDLTNIIYREAEGAGVLEVILTADPGYEVVLHSFDMASYPSTDRVINSLEIDNGCGLSLFRQTNVNIEGNSTGPRHSHFEWPTPISGQRIIIRFDASNQGNASDDVGIDNITFSQRVVNYPGDTNGDRCVNDFDLVSVIFDFGGPPSGVNGNTDVTGQGCVPDGVVNDFDLAFTIFAFGAGCAQ